MIVFAEMIGRTCVVLEGKVGDDALRFLMRDGSVFAFWYEPDCCGDCHVEEVVGDLADLVDAPLLEAEEVSSDGHPDPKDEESFTWTFYKFRTSKGAVTVRWLGTSNGYYSESVSYSEELKPRTPGVDALDAFIESKNPPKADEQAAILDDELERLERLVH